MRPEKLQALVLRGVGTIECLAFVAVVLPYRWMETAHGWLGLGGMPDGAVLEYIIREASLVYGMHGVFLWFLAWDVQRFRPLIVLTGIFYFLGGPVIAVIGATAGMPWFWFAGEGLSCLAVGIILIRLTGFSPTDLLKSGGGHVERPVRS